MPTTARRAAPYSTGSTARLRSSPAMAPKSPHLDILGSYQEAEVAEAAVTVTDPGHPLYGRRFAVVPAVEGARSDYIHVARRGGTVLPLPVGATSLRPLPREVGGTKLTLEAIHD